MSSTRLNDITIDAVFFAQTHVLKPGAPFFKLVGNKATLIKVHVLSSSGAEAPLVEANWRPDLADEALDLLRQATVLDVLADV